MKNVYRNLLHTSVIFIVASITAFGQKPSYTANDKIAPYTGVFAYGCNPGYFGGYDNNNPSDIKLSDLFNKINLHTSRLALYDDFLESYGIGVRFNEFKYYTATLNMQDLTVFLNQASTSHRDNTTITCASGDLQSLMFKNLYTPIWDDSTNGTTPINDQNYFAAYIYKVALNYGKYVKFYEIWNEPDFVSNGNLPLLTKGQAGNWWENNPDPCDLVNMNAPVTSYIRMLRIAYEVIKSVDPNAMVTTGGLGYDNFLDAILRNTDSPDGKVTSDYPLKGGAYFDVFSFHSYPQYALSSWDNTCSCRKYYRYSDNAAQQVIVLYNKFKTVLTKYGYDGKTYPAKYTILTETNIPAKSSTQTDHIGSPEAQRNFIMKMFVATQKQDFKQTYIFDLGDGIDESAFNVYGDGYDVMGLYYNLNKATPSTATPKDAGYATKTMSGFLYGYAYDAAATAALNIPSTMDGAAFTSGTDTRYVLWVKTVADQNEFPTPITYTFPTSLNVQSIQAKQWDFSKTNSVQTVNGKSISLTGSPTFITIGTTTGLEEESLNSSSFSMYPNPANRQVTISFAKQIQNDMPVSVLDMQGKEVARSTLENGNGVLSISNLSKGIYQVQIFTGRGLISQKLVVVE